MSHFTTLKTRIMSKDNLIAALDDLNIVYELGDLEIRGYEGIRTRVEIRIPTSNSQYQIGFRRIGDSYELVADWYGIKEFSSAEFLAPILQRYAYRTAMLELAKQDFTVVEEEIRADNTIHITVRRMV